MEKKSQNSAIYLDNNKEKIEVKNIDKNTYKYNPPKKKQIKKHVIMAKSIDYDKDSLNSDINSSKNIQNNNKHSSEISFEKISKEKPVYIDNLVNPGNILKNNYLDYPLKYENNIFLKIYQDALDLNKEENGTEIKIYFNILIQWKIIIIRNQKKIFEKIKEIK